jgi:hypothetical protein
MDGQGRRVGEGKEWKRKSDDEIVEVLCVCLAVTLD